MRFVGITTFFYLCFGTLAASAEPLFSGPQIGEALVPFEARVVFGEQAGESLAALDDIEGAPTLLVFVHQVTRPSIGMIRLLMNYAATKEKSGLKSRLVFLTVDPTDTEAWLRRARRALPKDAMPLISMDGAEGPGAYGLHRKVTLTVLVANRGKVTANFALVQPSIQADAPKIGHAIVKTLGGDTAPTLKDMGFEDRAMAMRKRNSNPEQDGIYRRMMSPVIQKTATPDEVAAAAKRLEEMAAKTDWFKARVYTAANLIVNGGKLSNYGTAEAQAYLKKWSKEFAPAKRTSADAAGATESSEQSEPADSSSTEDAPTTEAESP